MSRDALQKKDFYGKVPFAFRTDLKPIDQFGSDNQNRVFHRRFAEGQLTLAKLSALVSRNAAVVVVLCYTGIVAVAAQSAPPLELKQTIPLSGIEGRIDHFAFDPAGERLFVCALGNNTVEVLDLRRGERAHSIASLSAPQGAGYAPEVDRLFVANDKDGVCKIYDGKSFQVVAELNLGDDADNVRYDEIRKNFYVGFGNGGIAVVNASDGKQVGSIKLSAHPESFQVEKKGDRIFVNVPNSRHVAVIDGDKGKVVARWKTDLAVANFPMALDEANHRLFLGCRFPSKLVVLNTDSGDVVAKVDISGDADDVFYDSKRHRIYAICGVGKIDVIEQTDPNTYRALTKFDTANGARTGLFVPERDALFVAVPRRGSQQAEIRCYEIK
jgi:DNA-binding beta-propeller fold protein YncE